MFEHALFHQLLENSRYTYRNINLIALALMLLILGLAFWGGYVYFFGVNPVREDNYAYIAGTLDSAKKWKSKDSEGFNITLRESQRIFSPLIDLDAQNEDNFLENETPGNPVKMIVDKSELDKPLTKVLGIDMNHVHIFELKTSLGEYLILEESIKDFASERKYALFSAIILPLLSLFFLPYLVIRKKDSIDQITFNKMTERSTFLPEMEFKTSYLKISVLIFFDVLFVGGGIFMLIGSGENYIKYVACSIIVFFGGALSIILRDYLNHDPIVLINKEGINDRRMKIGIIPWNEIKKVSICKVNQVAFLSLTLNNENYYFGQLPSWEKFIRHVNAFFHYPKFYISFVGLTPSLQQAIDYIFSLHSDKLKT